MLKKPISGNTDWFTNPQPNINVNISSNPWYKDLTSWLWIGGVICTLGLVYGDINFVLRAPPQHSLKLYLVQILHQL